MKKIEIVIERAIIRKLKLAATGGDLVVGGSVGSASGRENNAATPYGHDK